MENGVAMNNLWQNNFPPFWIWLYGRLTQRARPVSISPADAWRQIEQAVKTTPQPNGWFQVLLHRVVSMQLSILLNHYLLMDTMKVQAVGVLPFPMSELEKAMSESFPESKSIK
jgi:hypothetical protein